MTDTSLAISFLVQSVIITIPGLLTPGPLTAVTVEHGTRSPHAGAFVTMGHGIVELPLVILLFLGIGRFTREPHIRFILALAGGIFLLYMSWKTFLSRNRTSAPASRVSKASFTAGILMTLANPFFVLWWATIGSALILRSAELGITVSILFYVLHFSSNFIWFYFISYMSYTGHSVFGSRYRYAVSVVCGVILLVFGCYFLVTAVKIMQT